MTRDELLKHAAEAVNTHGEHGAPEVSFPKVAALWTAYYGKPFAPHDVAVMLALLKVARIASTPAHADNWVDLAGYAACGAECVLKEDTL